MLKVPQISRRPKTDLFARLESNVRSYPRSLPAVFTYARGTEVWDVRGRRYLDFLAGAGSLNYGHNNPLMKKALLSYIQDDRIAHSLDLHTAAKESFLEALQRYILRPRSMDYVVQFTGPTGANAVEAALKIARKVTGRSNVIYFTNSFHGVSMGALAVTGARHFRAAAGVTLGNATAMPYDGYFGAEVDTLDYVRTLLSDPSSGVDHPAAVILEVVQGEGGLNAASVEWLQGLQALCQEKDILLIVDDIQAGCGRTCTFFSFEEAGLKPDIITLSKSLSGYGLPLSIVLIRRQLDVWKPGEHNGTFRGNNHAFVTATAMLKHYWRDASFGQQLLERSKWLRGRLESIADRYSPNLLDVRGRGYMCGVRCAEPDRAASIATRAFERGLLIERSGPWDEVIKCMMPLTTSMAEMSEGLDILETAMEEEFGARAPSFHMVESAAMAFSPAYQADIAR